MGKKRESNIIAAVEALLVDAHKATQKLNAVHDKRAVAIRKAVPDSVVKTIDRIEATAAKQVAGASNTVNAIKAQIQTLVLELGKSVKSADYGTASWCKGRDAADFSGLRALALHEPKILKMLSTGDPSVRTTIKK